MSRKCVFKFFGVLGAAIGSNIASVVVKNANAADWQSLSILLYGACVGMIVAWIVSMGMKGGCDDNTSCKK
jgi:hypothetical protein